MSQRSQQALEQEVGLFALQYYRDEPSPFRNVSIADVRLVAALWNLNASGLISPFVREETSFTAFYNAWLRHKKRKFKHDGKNPVG